MIAPRYALFFSLLAMTLIGCLPSGTVSPPVSSGLSPKERQALRTSLAKLEKSLQEKSPFVHSTLSDPASEEELARLWSELDDQKVECLEVWYRWHNGSKLPENQLLPLGRMLSIAEAVEDRHREKEIPLIDAKRKSALKILDDGSGDGFFVDVGSTKPRVFYHMLEDGYPQDFGTLGEFVGFISDVHAAGLARQIENGLIVFDFKRYQVLEQKYLQGIRSQ